jgi:hypothetical protein
LKPFGLGSCLLLSIHPPHTLGERFLPLQDMDMDARGGCHVAIGVLFSSAAGGAYWPIAIRCPSLGPFPSIGGGAHQPLTTLCPFLFSSLLPPRGGGGWPS